MYLIVRNGNLPFSDILLMSSIYCPATMYLLLLLILLLLLLPKKNDAKTAKIILLPYIFSCFFIKMVLLDADLFLLVFTWNNP